MSLLSSGGSFLQFCQAMDDVVYAHNVSNDMALKAVLDCEKLHSKSCPRLDEVV
jgi:hypothetical protein